MAIKSEIRDIVTNVQVPLPGDPLLKYYDSAPVILILSLFYALCSQLVLKLPFFVVPISIQPLPLFIAVELFGWHAVWAFILYYVQGFLGAPFFAHGGSGVVHIMGPTGGYLIGMFFAMVFLSAVRPLSSSSWAVTIFKLIIANIILYGIGLYQLSHFIPSERLLEAGLYPFIIGDTLKMITVAYCTQYSAAVRPAPK